MKGTIREKSPSKWEIRVSLGRNPETGKYSEISRTIKGAESTAQKALRKLIVEVEEGKHTPAPSGDAIHNPNSVTLKEVVELWRKTKSPSWSPIHRDTVDGLIRSTIAEDPIMNRRASELRLIDIESFYRRVSDKPSMSRAVHKLVRAALNEGVRVGLLTHNPAARAITPKVPKRVATFPTVEEVMRVANGIEETDPAFSLLVRVALATTARRAEIAALRWCDIDPQANIINISQALTIDQGKVVRKLTKAEEASRKITVGDETMRRLVERRASMTVNYAQFGKKVVATSPIFPKVGTLEHCRPDYITHLWSRYSKQFGVECRFHDIRHTGITIMLAGGIDPVTIASISGHTSPQMILSTYGHAIEKRRTDATSLIDDGINQSEGRTQG